MGQFNWRSINRIKRDGNRHSARLARRAWRCIRSCHGPWRKPSSISLRLGFPLPLSLSLSLGDQVVCVYDVQNGSSIGSRRKRNGRQAGTRNHTRQPLPPHSHSPPIEVRRRTQILKFLFIIIFLKSHFNLFEKSSTKYLKPNLNLLIQKYLLNYPTNLLLNKVSVPSHSK